MMKLTEMKVEEFVTELASSSPAPGGGTISALTAAFGAGLGSMVCRLTIGNAKYPDAEEQLGNSLMKLNKSYKRLVVLADEDTEAFNKVMAAFRLPKETDEEKWARKQAIADANLEATMVPLETAELAVGVMESLPKVIKYGNKNAISDCGVAIECAKTGATGALMNVGINLGSIKDEEKLSIIAIRQDQLKNRLTLGHQKATKELEEHFSY